MSDELVIGSGEIVALEAGEKNLVTEHFDGVTVGGRLVRLATQPDVKPRTAYLSFSQHAAAAQKGGWLQARWHEAGEISVEDFLSYGEVWNVNPFEVGARRPMSKRDFAAHSRIVIRLLSLGNFLERPLIVLSNGETRRVLLARALLKKPNVLVLDDPAAGLDAVQRERLKDIIRALAARGVAIVMTYRHKDEVPDAAAKSPRRHKTSAHGAAPLAARKPRPVIEISDLHLAFGARVLFDKFDWTVREGERWVLCGENGKGKTTLLSLISGDNPMAYAVDISVFGIPREVGSALGDVRARIGMVSPEMQAYLGADALGLVRDALKKRPRLLLLDEPFMNMDAATVREAREMISSYLTAHRRVAAIIVCHREDEIPEIFDKEMKI